MIVRCGFILNRIFEDFIFFKIFFFVVFLLIVVVVCLIDWVVLFIDVFDDIILICINWELFEVNINVFFFGFLFVSL